MKKKLVLIALLLVGLLAFVGCGDDAEGDAANGDAEGMYADGTYTGTGSGYGGDIEVEVTVEGGEITGIEVLSHSETDGIADGGFEGITEQVKENQGTDGVEVVSGATETSNGMIEAINDALEDAGAE